MNNQKNGIQLILLSFFYVTIMVCLTSCSYPVYRYPQGSRPIAHQTAPHMVNLPPSNPCPPPLTPSQPAPASPYKNILAIQSKTLIVIDPGHGGKDFGTYSLNPPKYHEKDLNLATSIMVKNFLQQLGYQVSMTRQDDVFLTLQERAIISNKQSPKIFVSIHYNSAPNKQAEGIEVYYYRSDSDKARSQKSKLLAEAILKKMIKNTQAKSRGVKHGDLAVIRETNVPAVLIEGGFLTNKAEMEKLSDASYLKKISWGIAQGIDEFATDNDN